MIRGIIQQVIEGVIKRFSATGRLGEAIADREYFQHYGVTSRPLAGAEAIIIREGNHLVMIASDDRRYRIALADEGDKIHLKRNRIVEIVAGAKVKATAPEVEIIASTKVTMTTPLLEVSGNVTAGGQIIDSVRSMAARHAVPEPDHLCRDPGGRDGFCSDGSGSGCHGGCLSSHSAGGDQCHMRIYSDSSFRLIWTVSPPPISRLKALGSTSRKPRPRRS